MMQSLIAIRLWTEDISLPKTSILQNNMPFIADSPSFGLFYF